MYVLRELIFKKTLQVGYGVLSISNNEYRSLVCTFISWKKNILDSDGQQYLQYQQNVQSQVLAWTTHKMWRNELADGILLII